MAKKSLLTETEIRQFMKLAKLAPLAETRFEEIAVTEEDEAERELDATEDELGDMDADVHDKDEEIDDLEADLGAEDAMDDVPDAGTPQTVEVEDFLGALEDALEKVMKQPVSTEMSPPEDEGEEVEMDMGMDVEEEPGMRDDMYENQDALVQEVARRVAARLQAKNDKQQLVDTLAERIMKRLTETK